MFAAAASSSRGSAVERGGRVGERLWYRRVLMLVVVVLLLVRIGRESNAPTEGISAFFAKFPRNRTACPRRHHQAG